MGDIEDRATDMIDDKMQKNIVDDIRKQLGYKKLNEKNRPLLVAPQSAGSQAILAPNQYMLNRPLIGKSQVSVGSSAKLDDNLVKARIPDILNPKRS